MASQNSLQRIDLHHFDIFLSHIRCVSQNGYGYRFILVQQKIVLGRTACDVPRKQGNGVVILDPFCNEIRNRSFQCISMGCVEDIFTDLRYNLQY